MASGKQMPQLALSDRDEKIWMDGQMVDWCDAKIHVLTHTLHYGCGAFEGVLLDASGFVSEGASENLSVIKNGVVYTPDLSAGARDEVHICDEAFFTGTAAEVTPIRQLDRIELGKDDYVGSRGPITGKIQTSFFDIVNGRNPKYSHWLESVSL